MALAVSRHSSRELVVLLSGSDQTVWQSAQGCHLFAIAPTLVPFESRCSRSCASVSFATPPLLTQRLVLHRPIESTANNGPSPPTIRRPQPIPQRSYRNARASISVQGMKGCTRSSSDSHRNKSGSYTAVFPSAATIATSARSPSVASAASTALSDRCKPPPYAPAITRCHRQSTICRLTPKAWMVSRCLGQGRPVRTASGSRLAALSFQAGIPGFLPSVEELSAGMCGAAHIENEGCS